MVVDIVVIILIILLFAFLIKKFVKSIKSKNFGACHENCKNCNDCPLGDKYESKK